MITTLKLKLCGLLLPLHASRLDPSIFFFITFISSLYTCARGISHALKDGAWVSSTHFGCVALLPTIVSLTIRFDIILYDCVIGLKINSKFNSLLFTIFIKNEKIRLVEI
jgi:hypothetical protein